MKAAEHKPASVAQVQKKSESPFFDQQSETESPFFAPKEAAGSDAFFSPKSLGVQTKLTVGQPNDKYEQEADSVADKVVQRLAKSETPIATTPRGTASGSMIQTKCATCEEEIHRKEENQEELPELQKKDVSSFNDGEDIQRKCAACEAEEHVQKKSDGAESTASSGIESRLGSSKGGGAAMDNSTRSNMESAMGADFSNVRVHTDSNAVQLSQDLNAHAFAHGNDVYFNQGKYNPGSTDGDRLLAHELVHTVQQGRSGKVVQKSPMSDDLRNVWTTQGKGNFFERLRNLVLPADIDTHTFVRETLVGDDRWLAQNLLTYGRESLWPIHLRIEREMKGWGDSGGKGVVFEILRTANGSQASNIDLSAVLQRVFGTMPDDIWLAQNLQSYGRESQWPIHLKVQREMKGWGDTGGSAAVFTILRTADGSEINNTQLTSALKGVFAVGSPDLILSLNLQTFGLEANWPIPTLIPIDNFAGRSTTDFGVGEIINLAFTSPIGKTAAQLGGLKWYVDSTTSGQDTLTTGGVDGLADFTAGGLNSTVVLVLKGVSGPNAGIVVRFFTINIVVPNDVHMVKVSGVRHTINTWGIGFRGNMFFRPMNVSFQNTQFKEGDATATASDYLSLWNGLSHCGTNGCTWISVGGGNNAVGSRVLGTDTADFPDQTRPFAVGSFSWPIPWLFRVTGTAGAGTQVIVATQASTADAVGTATISKADSGTFTKNATDPTSTF